MQLYEVSGTVFHTPLSGGEIAKLFRAGQLGREAKCKAVDAQRWRTVDELFPLLKYDTCAVGGSGADQEYNAALTRRHLWVAVAATLLVAIAAFSVFLLYKRSVAPAGRKQGAAAIAPPLRSAPGGGASPQRTGALNLPPSVAPMQPRSVSTPPVLQVPPVQPLNPENERRLAEERRWREQDQRDRATIADRIRAQNDRAAAQKREAAGADNVIPLDTDVLVTVGGSSVRVRVHDNDVTSFDVWINGARYRELKKNKGISGSGADETLIYSSGGASLYYVWELSGKLNHCRLRVR